MNTLSNLSILVLILGFGFTTEANVNLKKTKRLIMPEDVSEPMMSAETSYKLQPKTVSSDDTGQGVVSQIVDNTFSFLWDTSPLRKTQLGRAAEKVEKNMKAEVDFGRAKDSKVDHKLSIKLLAMQALAKLEYRGWVRAGINYDARAAKTEAEILENLATNKDLVLSHSVTKVENSSQVSLRWNW